MTLPAPTNFVELLAENVAWSAVPGADHYNMQLFDSTGALVKSRSSVIPNWTWTNVVAGSTYQWKVAAVDPAGTVGTWSSLQTFIAGSNTTLPPPPPPPPPVNPLYTLTALNRSQTPSMPAIIAGSNDNGAVVRQEVWNKTPDITEQKTEVWSPSNWRTTLKCSAGNTAVLSYPDVSSLVTDVNNRPIPVSNYAAINSSWSVELNETAQTNAEAAYDLWLNNYGLELMIWTYTVGRDRLPAGNDTGTDVTFGQDVYRLWKTGDNATVSLVKKVNAKTGSISILDVVKYLIGKGIYQSTVGFNMFTFGFEVPSTGGVEEVFEVKDYTLVTKAVAGKTI